MNIISRRSSAGCRTIGLGARAYALVALVLAAIAISASPASADGLATVKGCLSGEYGPYDEVASWQRGNRTFHLLCGDPTKGLIHIDRDHGPLDEGNNASLFLNCMDKIFLYGDSNGRGSAPNSTVWLVNYTVPAPGPFGQALALVDNSSGQVLTAYAHREGTDWSGCNAGTPSPP